MSTAEIIGLLIAIVGLLVQLFLPQKTELRFRFFIIFIMLYASCLLVNYFKFSLIFYISIVLTAIRIIHKDIWPKVSDYKKKKDMQILKDTAPSLGTDELRSIYINKLIQLMNNEK